MQNNSNTMLNYAQMQNLLKETHYHNKKHSDHQEMQSNHKNGFYLSS